MFTSNMASYTNLRQDIEAKNYEISNHKSVSDYNYCILPNNKIAAPVYYGIRVYDIETQKFSEYRIEKKISSLEALLDGRIVIIWGDRKSFSIYDLQQNEIRDIGVNGSFIRSLRVDAEGKIITLHDDNIIKIWSHNFQVVQSCLVADKCFSDLTLLKNNMAVTLHEKNVISLTDLTNKTNTILSNDSLGSAQHHYIELPNGNLVTRDKDNSIKYWNTQLSECLGSFTIKKSPIWGMVPFSNDHVLTTHWERTATVSNICLWDIRSGKCISEARTNEYIFDIQRVLDSPFFIVYQYNASSFGSSSSFIQLWELTPNHQIRKVNEFHPSFLKDCYFYYGKILSDGRFLLRQSGSRDDLILDFKQIKQYRLESNRNKNDCASNNNLEQINNSKCQLSAPQTLFNSIENNNNNNSENKFDNKQRNSILAIAPGGPGSDKLVDTIRNLKPFP